MTMMYSAMLFPDWNSLESVRRAHSDLEAAALVFFALLVVFDVLAHLSRDEKREGLLEKIGLSFFAVAVLAEIVAYPYGQRNDILSEQLIGSLDAQARQASIRASKAVTDSGKAVIQAEDALSKTGAAEGAMNEATNEALKAQTEASDALSLARGARQEADSFEHDIVSAKQQATEAESHLADALERATAAEKEAGAANEKLADRTLSDAQQQQIAQKLVMFAGQEYKVTAYWDSVESLGIANRIHQSLQMARWKYLPPPEGGAMLLGGIVGVQVWHHPEADDSTKKAAQALIDALNSE